MSGTAGAEMVPPSEVSLHGGGWEGCAGRLRSRLGVTWRGKSCVGAHVHQASVCQVRGRP